jgi:hypothetical protein
METKDIVDISTVKVVILIQVAIFNGKGEENGFGGILRPKIVRRRYHR